MREQRTSISTQVQTIGGAILVQAAIKYCAYMFIAWLLLTTVDGWVMAWLAQ